MAMESVRKKTRAEIVVEQIRTDIDNGVYKAGERLDEVTLAGRYGVSRTPVREALSQLGATGEVIRQAHRGCRVSARAEVGE